ncbi:MAG: hypothetical protein IKV03_06070 [Alphaproteobacteria bacterium]|nr:hypothetical protein [Alphaproteobacteria bacterium]
METLVEVAKRLGIKPQNGMTLPQMRECFKRVHQEFSKSGSGQFGSVFNELYNIRKTAKRDISENQYSDIIDEYFLKKDNQLKYLHQTGSGEKGGFLWHSASKGNYIERFVADIDIVSPDFLKVIPKLDEFIKKYNAGMKIPHINERDRSDTLNLYMTQEITPDILSEFYDIVKPCVKETYHTQLDGMSVYNNGHEIKGIKIGPENRKGTDNDFNAAKKQLEQDMGFDAISFSQPLARYIGMYKESSLGEKSASVQIFDLAYYLIGKEGKSPFQLKTHDGHSYNKILDISNSSKANENDKREVEPLQNVILAERAEDTYFYKAIMESKSARPVGFENQNFQKDYPQLVDLVDQYFNIKNNMLVFKNPQQYSDAQKGEVFEKLNQLSGNKLNSYTETYNGAVLDGVQYTGYCAAILKDLSIALDEKRTKNQVHDNTSKNLSQNNNVTFDFSNNVQVEYNNSLSFNISQRSSNLNAQPNKTISSENSSYIGDILRSLSQKRPSDVSQNTSKTDKISYIKKTFIDIKKSSR